MLLFNLNQSSARAPWLSKLSQLDWLPGVYVEDRCPSTAFRPSNVFCDGSGVLAVHDVWMTSSTPRGRGMSQEGGLGVSRCRQVCYWLSVWVSAKQRSLDSSHPKGGPSRPGAGTRGDAQTGPWLASLGAETTVEGQPAVDHGPLLCQDTWFERCESSPTPLSSHTHPGGNSIYRICQLPFLFTQAAGLGWGYLLQLPSIWPGLRAGPQGTSPAPGKGLREPQAQPHTPALHKRPGPMPHCGVLLLPTETGRAESRGSQAQGREPSFLGS